MIFVILNTQKNFFFHSCKVLVTETQPVQKNKKKSENTRLQQSWNHNGNSRNTQEVFGLDNGFNFRHQLDVIWNFFYL